MEKLLKGPAKRNGITLNIHPFIAAFLTKGFPSIRIKWYLDHKKWVKIQPRDAYTYLEYRFKNKDGKNYLLKSKRLRKRSRFFCLIFIYLGSAEIIKSELGMSRQNEAVYLYCELKLAK